jgi:thermitase
MIRRNRILRASLVFIFLCLLAWNLGFGTYPASEFQEQAFSTTEMIHTEEFTATTTPEPTVSPTDTPAPTASVPAITATPISETDPNEEKRPPLPAAFAPGTYAQNELVIRFKPSTSRSRIDECFQRIEAQVLDEIEVLNTFVLVDESGELASTFYQVLDCAGALYVEPNFFLQAADIIPNDPNWGIQYGLVNIRAPQGWDLSTGSSTVTIAIVDSGVDLGHPDLAGKLVAGHDFVNNDSSPQDDYGHGTHVAGIAAAVSNNGAGIAGVSWGARIMPVKVLDFKGNGTFADTAAGVVWAVDHGAQIINLSLGADNNSSILEDAVNYAQGKGAIVIAAAGNAGSNSVLYPARYPSVIAVAKTNSANNWDGSNYGPEIDLAAPGAQIYSTVIGGYDYKSGSSMSTGFVSGLAAVLMSVPGNSAPGAIEYQMESTALDIEFNGWDEYTGAGLIQMDAAVQLALQSMQPSDDADSSTTGTGAGPGTIQIAGTNTPIAAWTASLISTFHGTGTIVPTETAASATTTLMIPSPTSETTGEVEAQADSANNAYLLPCLAIFFILLGVIVLFVFRKKEREL